MGSILTIPRVDGQIWIDRMSPYSLKYYINGSERIVEASASYDYVPGPGEDTSKDLLSAGTVVKLTKNNSIAKAQFPDDIEGVLGVTSTALKRPSETVPREKVAITQRGYIILDHPDETFATPADYTLGDTGNGYSTSSIIGAPVYWFIGRLIKVGDVYHYESPAEDKYKGKLTLATPSGFKALKIADDSLNVGYDNLPQVGSVASITAEGTKITSMTVHLNFSKFDSSLEWNWPLQHTIGEGSSKTPCGKIVPQIVNRAVVETPITIRHGLFAASNNYIPRSFISATAAPDLNGEIDEANEFSLTTAFDDNYPSNTLSSKNCNHNYTKVYVSSPEIIYCRVSGRVNYKFDKNHVAK